MKVELITVEYGGTIPTVQFGNRTVKFTAVVEITEDDTPDQAMRTTLEMLANQYEQEEATIKSRYSRS